VLSSSRPTPYAGREERVREPFRLEKNRLDILIDAVYAIAMTVLVLDVKLPNGVTASDLPSQLAAMLPKFGVYAVAFSTIALMWVCHYYAGALIRFTDYAHVALNLAPLMLVALVPFSAATLGTYPASPWAISIFAGNVAATTLLYGINWHHCRRHLIAPYVDDRLQRELTALIWSFFAAECFAAALAFVVPPAGFAFAALLVPLGYALVGVWERRLFSNLVTT
jgi:uncharacterized membrane protein